MSIGYMVNPRGSGRARKKRRSAKQRAATKKMLAARKKSLAGKKVRRKKKAVTSTRRSTMARRRRKSSATTKRRRRRSSAKRAGAPVRLVRRGRTVYQGNPRRRRRSGGRRRYRSNPDIIGSIKQGVMDAGATLVGGAVARTVNGFVPLPDTGIIGAAKGIGVAVAVGMLARKVVSSDTARFLTAGAMQVPLKGLITSFVPGAGAFLGDYDNIGAYELDAGVSDYLDTQNNEGMSGEESFVEAYEM